MPEREKLELLDCRWILGVLVQTGSDPTTTALSQLPRYGVAFTSPHRQTVASGFRGSGWRLLAGPSPEVRGRRSNPSGHCRWTIDQYEHCQASILYPKYLIHCG